MRTSWRRLRRRSPSPSSIATLLVAAVPWTWFLVRDDWPVLDGVALAMPLGAITAAIAPAVGSLLLRRYTLLLPAASVVLVGLAATIAPWRPLPSGEPAEPVVVRSANVRFDNSRPREAAAAAVAGRPDVLVLIEVSKRVDRIVRATIPHGHRRDSGDYPGSEGVYSRWPVRVRPLPADTPKKLNAVLVTVERPGAPFDVLAVHVPVPARNGPFTVSLGVHRELIRWISDTMARRSRPTVLAGDFNLSDRAWGYRHLRSTLRDAVRSGWVGPTAQRGRLLYFLLRTDYLFTPRSWCADDGHTLSIAGSDHRGVEATVGACQD
jgi:endonuclease/exonuclease/phosphatase (EEP) superfamily protein YafD